MAVITVLVLPTDNRAPLGVAIVGAKVGDHHDDALASSSASATGRAS